MHEDPRDLGATLRTQMARWPTGAAVVTSCSNGRLLGKTVNSFHATSLRPPLVGWCLDHRSSHLEDWLTAEAYVVHVLAEDHGTLLSRFCGPVERRFDDGWRTGPDGVPLLEAEVPLRLTCRVQHRLTAGDHTYLVGEVMSLDTSEATPIVLQR
ncbi:flavin reductase family protein [Nocardioides acrostichi]|uniref:Flavin reductase n=1 Tax=Nocardioides acrostichi TaxID=2784339 RepID=A0A930UZU5_9ACTN|nr:flavin reductase family protein [Nocardioides acrostichi]MBF4161429.1 flavin reductase [Nocardioides acrostichi]